MSTFSVPNPPYPRKKKKNGNTFYSPEDESTLSTGTHILEYDGDTCLFKPEDGPHEMEDDTILHTYDGIIIPAQPQGE